MPKKSFKKQKSLQLRAKRRTQKAAKMAAYARSQIQRQANRSSARDLKELNRILETVNNNNENNGNNSNNGTNVVTPLALESGNNNNNEPFVGPEWNVNQPSFGRAKRRVPSKTMKKEKRNLLLTRKQKQKQRNLSLQRARLGKEEERELETASLPNLVSRNRNENANLIGNFGMPNNGDYNYWNNPYGPYGEYYNYNYNNIENQLEREQEEKELQKMRDQMAKAEKNRFYIRFNRQNTLYTPYQAYKNVRGWSGGPQFMQVLYLSKNPSDSYYYEYVKHEERDDEYSYNSWGPYRRLIYLGWKVYKKDPAEYFRPYFTPHYYNFYGPNENEFDRYSMDFANNDNAIVITSRNGLLRHLKSLPHFQEEREKELLRISTERIKKEQAKATGPAKLKELQMKGIEGWIQQMEGKTGMTMPRDVQNLIERGIKPIDYRYYQGRDNLQRIKTNLFNNQVDVPRHLKKVSTNLFQKN